MSIVQSDQLEFCYGEAGFAETMRELSERFEVGFIVTSPAVHHGWPAVRVVGEEQNVVNCITTQWEDGSGSSWLMARSVIGDKVAHALWNAGISDDEARRWRTGR